HRAADDERISGPDQKQLARRRDRLSRPRLNRQHNDQPDRPGGRRDRDDHGRLFGDQPDHLVVHEPLQPRRRTSRALVMADVDVTKEVPLPVEGPGRVTSGPVAWLRANLFNSIPNTIRPLPALYFLAVTIPPLIRWALIDAIWSAPNGRACHGDGACWAFIAEKGRFILFGRYPYQEHWRPLFTVVIFIAMILASCDRRLWGRRLAGLWLVGLVAVGVLMWGGIFGMTYVEAELWNGLPLTLILATVGIIFAFPLAIALALGRRSRLPAVRAICVG